MRPFDLRHMTIPLLRNLYRLNLMYCQTMKQRNDEVGRIPRSCHSGWRSARTGDINITGGCDVMSDTAPIEKRQKRPHLTWLIRQFLVIVLGVACGLLASYTMRYVGM
jgi:hypothetical protein